MEGSTTVTFHSPTDSLTLVRTPANRRMNDQGQWDTIPGSRITFSSGRFETSDAGELSFLRGHDQLNRLFFEHGAEVGRASDSAGAMVAYIVDLAIEGQAHTIADILVAERNAFSRPEVLAACEKALERIGAMVPAAPAPPEHQLERVRQVPATGPSPVGFTGTERPITVGPTAPPDPAQVPPAVPTPEVLGGQPGPAAEPTVPQQ
jgi:hypothetical protein